MKKSSIAITLLLAAALLLSAGCGQQQSEAKDVDLDAFYAQLESDYSLGHMTELDADTLDAFYPGLSELEPEALIARAPMMSAVVSEIVIIKCADEDVAGKAAEIFRQRIEAQAGGGAWYPESVELWGKAQIAVNGQYALLAAHQNATDIAADFEALFSK